MKIEFEIAKRYLISRKKSTAINIISIIAIIGIAVGTCSTILITSVFNGFEEVIMGMFDQFNPDIKVLPKHGKRFEQNEKILLQLKEVEGVKAVCRTIEETAFFEYGEKRDIGKLKGVDKNFDQVIQAERFIKEGEFKSSIAGKPAAFISTTLSSKLQISYQNQFEMLNVYMKSKKKQSSLSKPFSRWSLVPSGRFDLLGDDNQKMVIIGLEDAKKILLEPHSLSAIEIGLINTKELIDVKGRIEEIMGDDFEVLDRRQQQSSFLKLMNIEKWIGFAILCMALLLVSFNMIGSMWMIIMEKEKDICILKSIGLSDTSARKIFLYQGIMLSGMGLILGVILALVLYFLQKEFGLVTMDSSMPFQSYPIDLKLTDFLPIVIVVICLGILASLPAGYRAYHLDPIVNNNW